MKLVFPITFKSLLLLCILVVASPLSSVNASSPFVQAIRDQTKTAVHNQAKTTAQQTALNAKTETERRGLKEGIKLTQETLRKATQGLKSSVTPNPNGTVGKTLKTMRSRFSGPMFSPQIHLPMGHTAAWRLSEGNPWLYTPVHWALIDPRKAYTKYGPNPGTFKGPLFSPQIHLPKGHFVAWKVAEGNPWLYPIVRWALIDPKKVKAQQAAAMKQGKVPRGLLAKQGTPTVEELQALLKQNADQLPKQSEAKITIPNMNPNPKPQTAKITPAPSKPSPAAKSEATQAQPATQPAPQTAPNQPLSVSDIQQAAQNYETRQLNAQTLFSRPGFEYQQSRQGASFLDAEPLQVPYPIQ